METIRFGTWFQGPTGFGHGGWAAKKLVDIVGQPATVAIRAPIPLETDLVVVEADHSWLLVDRTGDAQVTILEAEQWEPDFPRTPAVTVADATAARGRFRVAPDAHLVPFCFSCGTQADSMHVHAGPLGDGRHATDWLVPDWAIGDDDNVDSSVMWAALDCAAAWFVNNEDAPSPAFTVQFAVEVLEPLLPRATYSLVGWAGDSTGWDGRKRGAASAAFDEDGTCVAQSRSFWVAV